MKSIVQIPVAKCDCNCIHKDKLEVAKEYLDKEILKVDGHGGWTLSDFRLYI